MTTQTHSVPAIRSAVVAAFAAEAQPQAAPQAPNYGSDTLAACQEEMTEAQGDTLEVQVAAESLLAKPETIEDFDPTWPEEKLADYIRRQCRRAVCADAEAVTWGKKSLQHRWRAGQALLLLHEKHHKGWDKWLAANGLRKTTAWECETFAANCKDFAEAEGLTWGEAKVKYRVVKRKKPKPAEESQQTPAIPASTPSPTPASTPSPTPTTPTMSPSQPSESAETPLEILQRIVARVSALRGLLTDIDWSKEDLAEWQTAVTDLISEVKSLRGEIGDF